jgi:predicted transcriptional regulator
MSKTVELQIEKSRHLVEGLRKHLKGIGGGATNDEIGQMEQALKELEAANAEVDRLREELSPKVKHMNEVLARVKATYADKKKTLKGYYPQERWADYGIPDKR